MVEVTQADREAAASVAVLVEMRELIRSGRADHHAEPFARHRVAAAQAERVAVLEWLREEAKMARIRKADMDELTSGYVNALANAIRAIEAREHHAMTDE